MREDLSQALAECLSRLEAGQDIESCLRDQGPLAAQLRPLLETAAAVHGLPVEPYAPPAFQAGRTRLRATVASQRSQRRRAWPLLGLVPLRRPPVVFATAALVALIALLAVTTDLFRFGSTTTQAEVQGVLSAVRDGSLVVNTPDGLLSIGFNEQTQVVDLQGQAQTPQEIVPGDPVRVELEAEQEGGTPIAVRVEVEEEKEEDERSAVEVEFTATVDAIDGSDLTVQAAFGAVVVRITPQTQVEGSIVQGALIEVHATKEGDGFFTAREIKVLSAADGDGDGQGGGQDGGGGDDHGDKDKDGENRDANHDDGHNGDGGRNGDSDGHDGDGGDEKEEEVSD